MKVIATHVIHAQQIESSVKSMLLNWGFGERVAGYVSDFFPLFIVLIASVLIYYGVKILINRILKRIVSKSENKWDDHLYEQKFFTRLALFLPAIILQLSLTPSISNYPEVIGILSVVLKIFDAAVLLLVGLAFLNALYHIYGDYEVATAKPIKGYVQLGKIVLYIIIAIIMISVLIGQSPLNLLAGLGAMSAVLMLIFRDSLLGFVAGVQISNNHMLHIGDWVSMPKYNADGTVFDISLVTVKIRNFDNSVSCVPTYAFISDSFQNWRSMGEAGGRRLKRSVNIDVFTIRFADEALNFRLKEKGLYRDFRLPEAGPVTNLGLFRQYMYDFLRSTPLINSATDLMVRHQPSTDTGFVLEIYAFINPPDWATAENTAAAIFEHIYALLPEFGLSAFQRVSGRSLQL